LRIDKADVSQPYRNPIMKTMSLALTTFLALAFFTDRPARAAESAGGEKPIDTILTQYLEALGGRAAIEKQTSRVMKASFEGFGMPAAADWTMYSKAPDKQMSEMEIADMGKMLDGFDGQVAWSKNPFTGLRIKDGQELTKQKRDADFFRNLHFKTTYTNLTAKGTEKVDGADVSVLEAKPSGDTLERFYFDAKSGLLVRQDSEFDMGEGRMKLQISFSDYRVVDGIKYPYLMRFNMAIPGQPAAEFSIKVKEIKHNEAIDDAKFAKPSA
jgi:zinc protease